MLKGSAIYWYRPHAQVTLSVTMARDLALILRLTRHWIHYGFIAHVVACIVIAAVRGVLGG